MRKSEKGFTLVELLVVVTVLVILATFLVPQVGAIRERTRRASCLENLRIIGVGLHTYAADNNGAFPTANVAATAFQSIYVNGNITDPNVFNCPSTTNTAPSGTVGGTNLAGVDYLYNDTDLNDQSAGTSVVSADNDTSHTTPAAWNVVRVSGSVGQVTTDPLGTDAD